MTLLLALSLALPASAGDDAPAASIQLDAQKVYAYRHEVFEGIGAHMKALSMMVKGEAPVRQVDMKSHAIALQAMSTTVPHLFPKGTGPDAVKDTEALATIWTDPEGFAAATKAFQDSSAALVTAAEGGDMKVFSGAFRNVGKSCGGCHDNFRKDDH
ncbi:MAG: cytochrome c [Alphaproteobacteria bacterium]|nr:cytochrome c [Alphaproteobacteria bacterium]